MKTLIKDLEIAYKESPIKLSVVTGLIISALITPPDVFSQLKMATIIVPLTLAVVYLINKLKQQS